MMETSKGRNEYELRAYKEAKPLFRRGECTILSQGPEEYGVNLALPSNTELHHV
jgi:hypothetical protein